MQGLRGSAAIKKRNAGKARRFAVEVDRCVGSDGDQSLRRVLASRRRISMYSHTRVTIRLKAPYHSM